MPYQINNTEVTQDDRDVSGRNATFVGVVTATSFAGSNTAPTGSIVWFAANSAPVGWLALDGSAVSRTTYSDLFAIFGTTFGSGNGSTTFNLPDMRGRFFKHLNNGNAQTGEGGIPPHTHGVNASNAPHTHPASFNAANLPHTHPANVGTANAPHNHPGSVGTVNAPHSHNSNSGGGGSHAHNFRGTIEANPGNARKRMVGGNVSSNTGNSGAHNHPTVNCNFANSPHSHPGNTSTNNVPHNHSVNVGTTNVPHSHPANFSTVNAAHSHNGANFTAGNSSYIRPFNIALLPIVKI
jgi:microcystin-dependent protein|tara:strand:+ start:1647 stop:2531 length:885 start_codon:yes stop_codon:yes gene_type:complete